MGAYPAYEQMNLFIAKGVFTNQSVGVATNVENNPTGTFS